MKKTISLNNDQVKTLLKALDAGSAHYLKAAIDSNYNDDSEVRLKTVFLKSMKEIDALTRNISKQLKGI